MKAKQQILRDSIITALALGALGCSSPSQDQNSGDVVMTGVRMSGAVVDGYVKGAVAYVDKNKDGTLDPNEPWAYTDIDGLLVNSKPGRVDKLSCEEQLQLGYTSKYSSCVDDNGSFVDPHPWCGSGCGLHPAVSGDGRINYCALPDVVDLSDPDDVAVAKVTQHRLKKPSKGGHCLDGVFEPGEDVALRAEQGIDLATNGPFTGALERSLKDILIKTGFVDEADFEAVSPLTTLLNYLTDPAAVDALVASLNERLGLLKNQVGALTVADLKKDFLKTQDSTTDKDELAKQLVLTDTALQIQKTSESLAQNTEKSITNQTDKKVDSKQGKQNLNTDVIKAIATTYQTEVQNQQQAGTPAPAYSMTTMLKNPVKMDEVGQKSVENISKSIEESSKKDGVQQVTITTEQKQQVTSNLKDAGANTAATAVVTQTNEMFKTLVTSAVSAATNEDVQKVQQQQQATIKVVEVVKSLASAVVKVKDSDDSGLVNKTGSNLDSTTNQKMVTDALIQAMKSVVEQVNSVGNDAFIQKLNEVNTDIQEITANLKQASEEVVVAQQAKIIVATSVAAANDIKSETKTETAKEVTDNIATLIPAVADRQPFITPKSFNPQSPASTSEADLSGRWVGIEDKDPESKNYQDYALVYFFPNNKLYACVTYSTGNTEVNGLKFAGSWSRISNVALALNLNVGGVNQLAEMRSRSDIGDIAANGGWEAGFKFKDNDLVSWNIDNQFYEAEQKVTVADSTAATRQQLKKYSVTSESQINCTSTLAGMLPK